MKFRITKQSKMNFSIKSKIPTLILTPNLQLQTELYFNHGHVAYQRGYGIWRTPKPEQTFEDTTRRM